MRGATQCAARLTQLIRSLRTKLGKMTHPATGDPVTQMILGVFSRDLPESKAREAFDCLRGLVVDYNELRVIPPIELTEMVGDIPQARLKCEDLSRALNKVFSLEHELSLERLRTLSRKDAVEYLEKIDGLEAYSRARVRLLGLNHHALPLDEAMWAYARREGIIDPKCSLEEAQSFLERRVPEGDALDVFALLERQAWAELGAAVRKGEVEHIASVPPDRTTRNLLQMVASGRGGEFDDTEELEEAPAFDKGRSAPVEFELENPDVALGLEGAEASGFGDSTLDAPQTKRGRGKPRKAGKQARIAKSSGKGKKPAAGTKDAAPQDAARTGKKKAAGSRARKGAKNAKSA